MCKKGLSVLVLLSLWMCLTGFASLGEEGKDTWNSMMEQLSAEEIDQLLAEENEWYGKVMANVEDSVTIRAEASADSVAVGKMFKGDAEEAARRAEEEKAKRTKNLGAIAASTDEVTLLAALIQSESGNQPYEGQLGVGAVVMNRVRSGSYPNTIQGVISAPGQFGPAATGKVSAILASGPKASCMQAAQAAINGETTVGTATHFRSVSSGMQGILIGNHVFW